MSNKVTGVEGFNEKNGAILAELLADPSTSEATRLNIINDLNEASKTSNFFEAMYNEMLTLGECPHCNHKNHWLVPEENLNQMGWVTAEVDPRVPRQTTRESCPEYEQACSKKRLTA